MTLSMGHSRGINYVVLLVYGYISGNEFLIPVPDVRNVRLSSTSASTTQQQPQLGSASSIAGVLLSATTFVSDRTDHFHVAMGQSPDVTVANWDNEPSSSNDYYGDVLLTHVSRACHLNAAAPVTVATSPCVP
eukprot:TRINITY_DN9776_c0_g1_i1.p3 TRINITY_DN9776_c0_g1~~TRINITY_DN9776_c0_g1_i1.p3  ORF type:complete len:133 (+),score=4.04 TRINITY_DN9776_c0_g1_i1:902-1300(+)